MQSMAKNTSVNRPAKLTVFNTLAYIYKESGIKGLYRGVTPRIGLGIWQTVRSTFLSLLSRLLDTDFVLGAQVCMVSFADVVKEVRLFVLFLS